MVSTGDTPTSDGQVLVADIENELANLQDSMAEFMDQIRADNGLINLHTGLGVAGRDASAMGSIAISQPRLNPEQRRKLRDSNFIVGNLVELLPAAMCDKFVTYSTGDENLTEWMQKLLHEVSPYMQEALEESREQGGAALVMYVDDGARSMADPISVNTIKNITGFNVLTSEEIEAYEYETNIRSPDYGEIKSYKINTSIDVEITGVVNYDTVIHASRVLPFHGRKVNKRKRRRNGGWGYSVIDRAIKEITNFCQSSDYVAASFKSFSQTVLFIHELAKKMASGKKEQMKEHVRTIAFLQSVLGILALDAGNERYEIFSRNYSNIDKVLEHLAQMAAGACDTPISLLLNRSTGDSFTGSVISNSSGSGGGSLKRDWADYVSSRQNKDLLPAVIILCELAHLCQNNPAGGKAPDKYQIDKPSIYTPTPKELAEAYETNAKGHAIYIDRQVYNPLDIAKALSMGVDPAKVVDIQEKVEEQKKRKEQQEQAQLNNNAIAEAEANGKASENGNGKNPKVQEQQTNAVNPATKEPVDRQQRKSAGKSLKSTPQVQL